MKERDIANGVAVQRVTESEARGIEPRVKTVDHALFVRSTATADSGQLIAAQQADFIDHGGKLRRTHPFSNLYTKRLLLRLEVETFSADSGVISAGFSITFLFIMEN